MNLLKRFRSSSSRRQLRKNNTEDQSSSSNDTSIRVNRRDSRDITMRAIPADLDESLRSLSSSIRTTGIYALKPSLSQTTLPLAEEEDCVMSCMICQLDSDESSEEFTTMTCGHKCHGSCITSWLQRNQNSCPMCREIIAVEVPPSSNNECNCCCQTTSFEEQEEETSTKAA